MPVVAVVNRKGGSGKSTLATHIAAWCANGGLSVMLGDVDRQQSTRTWLRLRGAGRQPISPWALDQKNVLRVPTGITHVVLDTPGGIHGFELARVVMFADAILIPVCNSVFDRESAAACHAELRALPRVASGRCRVAAVGMRIDGRTRGAQALEEWSEQVGLPYLGGLRDTQTYVRCIEQGLTIFDLPPSRATQDLREWQAILDWLQPVMRPPVAANDPAPGVVQPATRVTRATPASATHQVAHKAAHAAHQTAHQTARPATAPARAAAAPTAGIGSPRPAHLMPAQESLVHGSRLASSTTRQASPGSDERKPQVLKPGSSTVAPIPRFLQR